MNGTYPRFPLEPLLASAGEPTLNALARRTGRLPEQLYRWRRDGGVPQFSADRLACAIGRNPVEVWPEWAAS